MRHRGWLGLLLLLLIGCDRSSGVINSEDLLDPLALGGMPAPAEVLRTASFEDASQVRQGSEFDPAVPPARAIPDFDNHAFINLSPAEQPTLSPAWVVYSFDLTGYDEEPLVKLTWKNQPVNDSVYLALANWDDDRWDFVAIDPVNVTLPDLAPYISDTGKTLVAVIAIGAVQHQLRWLAIGDAPGPAKPVIFSVNPRSGKPGTDLTLSALVSGTQPFTYSWEFGPGLSPAASDLPMPTVTLGPEGDYSATVTITNKYGSDSFDFIVHSVFPSWTRHLIGDAGVNKFVDLDTTWQDHAMVAAEMDDGRISVFEFDGEGNPLWNRAYTGLPANRVTEIVLARPDYIELIQETPPIEIEARETYLTCYQDEGGIPGNAYLLKLAGDGSVLWYRLLGQGIPDVCDSSSSFDSGAFVCLAMTNGRTMRVSFNADGVPGTAVQTMEPASYYCCCTGSGIDGSGTYLAGEVNGKPTVWHTGGTSEWATQFNGNGRISDVYNIEGGVAIAGTLPQPQSSNADAFFMDMTAAGRLQGRVAFRTDPCKSARLSGFNGVVMLTCSHFDADQAQVYVFDSLATIYRAIRIEGFNGLLGGDAQYTRWRPPLPGEDNAPPQPDESIIFCGAAKSLDINVSQFTPVELAFDPTETAISHELEPYTLPEQELQIVPEEVGYALDEPSGNLDGLYLRLYGFF